MAKTPTPWEIKKRTIDGYLIGPEVSSLSQVVLVKDYDPSPDVCRENAYFIIEAVNAYDSLKAQADLVPELVETLDSARGLLARSWAHLPRKIQLYKDVECVLETMRLALAKADSSRTEVDRPPRPSPVSPLCSERRTGRGGREAIMPKGVKL